MKSTDHLGVPQSRQPSSMIADAPDRVFSGDTSREMWRAINKAETVTALREALYGVCCKLQEFESKVNPLIKTTEQRENDG